MSAGSELLIAILMAIGILGPAIPLIPGLALVWIAGGLWAYFDGGDGTRMWLFALMTLFAIIGFAAQFLLPAAAASSSKPPKNTLLFGGLAGLVGFFVIPIIGAPIGFMAGVYTNYFLSTGDSTKAWALTLKTAVAFGWAILIQVFCSVLIALTWILGLIIT